MADVPDGVMDIAWAAYCQVTSSPTAAVRAALEAAAPHLAAAERERCAQRLDAEAERHYDASATDDVPRSRLDAAARTYEHAARLLRQGGEGGDDG